MRLKNYQKNLNRRLLIFYFFCLAFCLLIIYKLVEVHVINHEFYDKKFKQQTIGRIEIPSFRGRILDRNGVILAYSLPSYSIAIRPTKIDISKTQEIYHLLKEKGVPIKQNAKEFDNLIKSLKEENIPFYFIARKFTHDMHDLKDINSIQGIEVIKEPSGKRHYNFECLTDIIGMVDIDDRGLEGVELYLDKSNSQITGKYGYYELIFDALGNPNYNRVLKYVPPVEGKDVKLSIDVFLQQSIDILAKQKLEYHQASEVTIVVSNKNGEILACVSVDREEKDFVIGGINKLYEPGSVFKVFTVVAALESKLSPYQKFYSGPSITVDGWVIYNADDGLYTSGYETIEDILTYSFNVGTVSLMQAIGRENFIKFLEKLGFYEYSGIEHPSDVKPLVGDLTNEPNIRLATISFGQGIAITPLHILRLMTIIANGGYKVPLTLIHGKNRYGEKVLSDFTVKEARKYLRSVVVRGTGKKAEIKGYFCAGKTGTAQVPSPNGGYLAGKYIASFVGFFPYFDPQYIIVVSVKEPVGMYYGGQVAAPIFREVASIIISRYSIKPYINYQEEGKNERSDYR
ncbi:MAG: penicillin-binding protein 2 [bacterium]